MLSERGRRIAASEFILHCNRLLCNAAIALKLCVGGHSEGTAWLSKKPHSAASTSCVFSPPSS
ncbi:hypothetical protein BQ8482_110609 [Mesorhizobium delmotii]|uniref:Uncharacterized protein n=1 Tax=Mesorhizobium delmotii TaxID=1631247 RepID=A0A2P9AC13_9HYPH|nr:hypothetical protein BQ8482_110609 [Mesorhizobium delmotii]